MFHSEKAICLVAATTLLLSGCSTIVESTKQEIVVSTEPSGAEVLRDGVAVGVTPLTLTVKRKDAGESILVRKEGYEDGFIQTKQKINPWFFGNIITGGLYGSTTDLVSGAAYKYDEDKYFLPLKKSGSAMISRETAIKTFAVVKEIDLRVDLENGGGETLDNLLKLANAESERESLVVALKKASKETFETIAFGDRVRDILSNKVNG